MVSGQSFSLNSIWQKLFFHFEHEESVHPLWEWNAHELYLTWHFLQIGMGGVGGEDVQHMCISKLGNCPGANIIILKILFWVQIIFSWQQFGRQSSGSWHQYIRIWKGASSRCLSMILESKVLLQLQARKSLIKLIIDWVIRSIWITYIKSNCILT